MVTLAKLHLIVFFVLMVKIKSLRNCSSTISGTTGLLWPSVAPDDRTLSKPICLDENREFLYRKCSDGQWDPEPRCSSIQQEKLPQCPDDYSEGETFCYFFIGQGAFPPKCPSAVLLPFDIYKEVVPTDKPVWAPANRTTTDDLDLIRWIEPSSKYKREVANYTISKPVKDKNCLIYLNHTYKAVSCRAKYEGVCAYPKIEQAANASQQLCGTQFKCLQSNLINESMCFCVTYTLQNSPIREVEFIQPFQNNVYELLTNKTCTIALKRLSNGTYIWSNSQKEVEYTFWSPSVSFHDGGVYGAATPDGWILTQWPLTCAVFEQEVPRLKPSLRLEVVHGQLHVVVENPQRLESPLYCFTNADSTSLIYNYLTIDILQEMLYALEPLSAPGHYWCETFAYEGTAIKTEKLFLDVNAHLEFIGIFRMKYGKEVNPLKSGALYLLQKTLFVQLDSTPEIRNNYELRIMKIVDVDEESQEITINFHFTGRTNRTDEDDQYAALRSDIKASLKGVNPEEVKMIDFLSTKFCVSTSDSLTWPKAAVQSYVSPKEFCFNADGNPITRLCYGDFVTGAKWQPFEECEIFKQSSITAELLEASKYYSGAELLEKIYNISFDYLRFFPLDVYLVGTLYSQLVEVPTSLFVPTVNNLLKIDIDILKESQLKLRATDKLLYFIDNVRTNTTIQIIHDKFIFISMTLERLSGFAVIEAENNFTVSTLADEVTFQNITKMKNIKGAIWLSPILRKSFSNNVTVEFSVYLTDAFFQQSDSVRPGIVFGVIQPTSLRFFEGPVNIIHKAAPQQLSDKNCAYWSYNRETRGRWKSQGRPRSSSNFLTCEAWHPGSFAVVEELVRDNVTESLEQLLASNGSDADTLNQLSEISEKFTVFQPVDVEYVAQILEKVASEDVDLEHLTRIVSNLQDTQPAVLLQSQIDKEATDRVLYNIDVIALSCTSENTVQAIAENFMILSVKYESSINGLVLLKDDRNLLMEILEDNESPEEISRLEGFNSAVLLSKELKENIAEGSRIVFSVFIKDVLFNEASGKKILDKIFGVVLPPIDNYSGPVSVLYRNSNIRDKQLCVHWKYDNIQRVKGKWAEDGNSRMFSNYIQCDFWHTTHFTYLIGEKSTFGNTSDSNFDSLDFITSVNCVISLISSFCIVVTAAFFQSWRQNTGNQILLNYSFAIILQIAAFYVSTSMKELLKDMIICTIVGAVLHYSTVSQFCWMLVIAVLQFRRFASVLEAPPKSALLKSCICGWVVPLLPIVCICLVDKGNYVTNKSGFCYPSHWGLYLGVWLPIISIIFVNFIIFSLTLYNVVHKKTECFNVGCHESLYQWRLAVMLFFLLGLTWTFGFLAQLDFGLVFEYLFCMTATLQGFIVFLFFMVFNVNTRYMYIRSVGNFCKKKFT